MSFSITNPIRLYTSDALDFFSGPQVADTGEIDPASTSRWLLLL